MATSEATGTPIELTPAFSVVVELQPLSLHILEFSVYNHYFNLVEQDIGMAWWNSDTLCNATCSHATVLLHS